MTFNYSKKFSTNTGPTLEDFELGFIFAACSDLEKYPEFSQQQPDVDDLPYITVIMLRDQAKHIFEESYPQLMKAASENLNMSQLGSEAWLASNSKEPEYLKLVAPRTRESLTFLFNFYGTPSELVQENNNIVVLFKDPEVHASKMQEYQEMYQSLVENDNTKKNKP